MDPPSRRARRSRDQVTVAAATALGAGLVLGGGGWALAMRDTGCDGARPSLSVTADPALAPAALAAADRFNAARDAAGQCASVRVVAGDSGEVAGVFRTARGTPDVWIPDSSLWPDLVGREAAGKAPSVASSPIVFAVSKATANRYRTELERRSWNAFQQGHGTPAFHLRLSDPERTGSGMASLLALQASSGSGKGALDRFTTVLRTAKTLPYGKGLETVFGGGGSDESDVVVVPEQVALQRGKGDAERTAVVYPRAGTPYLDFPYVVATSDAKRKRVADGFLAELRSPRTAADLKRAGLRGPGQAAPRPLPVVRPGAAAGIQEIWRKLGQGLNVLALIDPSGGGTPMPGASGTRLDAMLKALSTGFTLVPDDSSFGLWTLTGTPGRPYRQAGPMRELGARSQSGGNQRLTLQEALEHVRPRSGASTGLDAAIEAAYREVDRNYEKDRLNVVLVLTAGARGGAERTELGRTAERLRGAFDARRPVSVIVLGFGAEADPSLRKVAAATDGGAYKIDNPGTVMRLFLRSDQLRVCDDPRCPE
ncbi:substrate-binding and VWA domain-containing protein [Spirillospora sp. CA-142024]|uniref:substrate-binding and VWA domain-containing protein n=1 Tax=Spirillospora sp. CA-142024 TaxID=3240036 RepID=UPI003D8F8A25